jgi:hypothetical protein
MPSQTKKIAAKIPTAQLHFILSEPGKQRAMRGTRNMAISMSLAYTFRLE